MGTWGPGPFESDTAEDFLEGLEEQSAMQRLAVVERTFHAAIEGGGNPNSDVLPEEVISAAAVVAANVPAGRSLIWNDDYPGITEWLAQPIASALAASAIRALEVALPVGGWFWRSWVDADEKEEARSAVDGLRSVLRSVGENGGQ